MEIVESLNLTVLNDGNVPTFPRASSFLDLTLVTQGITRKICTCNTDSRGKKCTNRKKWMVMEEIGYRQVGQLHRGDKNTFDN